MGTEKKDPVEKCEGQEQTKQPYTTPQLTVHGDVEKITGNLGTGTTDALVASGIT